MSTPVFPHVAPIRQRFWAAIVALVAIALTVTALTQYQRATHAWVEHTRIVVATTRNALLQIAAAQLRYKEDGRKDDGTFSRPVSQATLDGILSRFDSVTTLTTDNPQQNPRIIRIRKVAEEWTRAVAAGARSDTDAAPAALETAVQAMAGDFIATETALYDVRLAAFRRAQALTLMAVLGEVLVVAAVLIGYSRKINSQFGALTDQHDLLRDQAHKLEEQAVELEVSNQELFEAVVTAEQETRESARAGAILFASLDNAPLAFALFDHELKFMRVNVRWVELTGESADEHIGRTLAALPFSPEVLAETVRLMERARHEGVVTTNAELSGHSVAHPADVCHWLLSCAPVTLADREIIGVAVALLDVTDRNKLSEQLLHAQKMEAVGRLAGGIAHDFNNSLAVINAYASMLSMSDDISQEDRDHVNEIADAVERAASLTRQLLAFGRRQITQPRIVDVNSVAQRMLPMIARLIPSTISLSTRFDADPSTVSIDPSQLEQVLMNLVSNASHAMADGGTLTIESDSTELDEFYAQQHAGVTPGPYVMLSISDNGIGMDEETSRRIFEPFFTTKESGKGTGLGLTSVYSIARSAGGHIWCYSEIGEGTTFKVYLPVSLTEAMPSETAALITNSTSDVNILLVEDDEQLRPAIAGMLRQSGYTVFQAANGDAALAVLAAEHPNIDLVITDLVMPGMSGREMSEKVAADYPGVPVLFTSGYTDDLVTRRGMIERGWPFVQKPFTREQLRAGIERALAAN